MQFQLKRYVNIGRQMREAWVTFEATDDDMIVKSVCHKGRDMIRRVTDKELTQLCQSVTVREMGQAIYEAKREAEEDRAGFGD